MQSVVTALRIDFDKLKFIFSLISCIMALTLIKYIDYDF